MTKHGPHKRRTPGPARPVGAPSLPPAFVAQARDWLGAECEDFLAACARPPRLALRANMLKGGLPALLDALDAGAAAWPRVPWWPDAVTPLPPGGKGGQPPLPSPEEAARLAAHLPARVGALYAQDPSALAAVAALDPRPGERVLDLCAAPGGKSTAIADRLGGRGLLVSNDIDRRRARELERTLERWGAMNAAVLALLPERLAELAPAFFDRVLVDAPCSGEAMFGRRAHAAPDWSPEHVAGCAARQRHVLAVARRLVRPGGVLVYATCTFNPSENEAVIASYLSAHPADALEDAVSRLPGASPGHPEWLSAAQAGPRAPELTRCARLWPQRNPGAGHFVALIRVNADGTPAGEQPGISRGRSTHRAGADAENVAAVQALVGAVAPGLEWEGEGSPCAIRGDRAFLVARDLPRELAQAAPVPGLRVAERRGRTWRPAHALAMALRPAQARGTVRLDGDAASTFLAGRPIAGDGDGYLLATWHDYSLGWARARGGTLTPQLPSGLREPLPATP